MARSEQATVVVVGVPMNLPGKSNRMSEVCGQLAECLREENVEVRLVDEALTSVEAEARLSAVSTRGAAPNDVHSEAARLILERFFNGGR